MHGYVTSPLPPSYEGFDSLRTLRCNEACTFIARDVRLQQRLHRCEGRDDFLYSIVCTVQYKKKYIPRAHLLTSLVTFFFTAQNRIAHVSLFIILVKLLHEIWCFFIITINYIFKEFEFNINDDLWMKPTCYNSYDC